MALVSSLFTSWKTIGILSFEKISFAIGSLCIISAGLSIILDNGQISAQMRKWTINLVDSIIEHHNLPQSVEAELMETVDIQACNGSIIVCNNTSAMP